MGWFAPALSWVGRIPELSWGIYSFIFILIITLLVGVFVIRCYVIAVYEFHELYC